MNRHERRAAKSNGNRMVYHKAIVRRHAGEWWAMTPHYCMKLKDQASFDQQNGEAAEPPLGFVRMLDACPPDTNVTTCKLTEMVLEDGGAVFSIGGVLVQQQYLWGIASQWGDNVEWRATVWYEPVYALQDGKVVGCLMGLQPEGIATA